MQKVFHVLLGAALASLTACQVHSMETPTADQVKAIRILEKPDVSTLEVLGHVDNCIEVAASESDPEEVAREALVATAIRRFPNTGVMFAVDVRSSGRENCYCVSGIAARRKGG
jgi:hypothetical protein